MPVLIVILSMVNGEYADYQVTDGKENGPLDPSPLLTNGA
jgi:hypothetical protein